MLVLVRNQRYTLLLFRFWDEVKGEAGFFSATIDKKLPSNFYQVSYRKGTKSFKFKIFWVEECKDAQISINGIKGTILNYVLSCLLSQPLP